MPPWLIKAGIQRGISLLPHSHRWNELFQRYVTRSITLDRLGFESRLSHCTTHLRHYAELRPRRPVPAVAVEIGTGWHPVVAIGLFLCGVEAVWTYDITPLLAPDRVERVLAFFDRYARSGELNQHLPAALPERVERLRRLRSAHSDPAEILVGLGVQAVVGDARSTGLPDGTVDLILSTAVLEYIALPALIELFGELRRIASPDAAMSHYVDLSDQYSHFDRRITAFNFLRYPTRYWQRLDNALIPQNRLRISDYRSAIEQGGWVVRKESAVRADAAQLTEIRVAPEFRIYRLADLLVVNAWLAAIPKTSIDSQAALEPTIR